MLISLSPLYYGYLLNDLVSSWQWIKDLGQDQNYPTYHNFNIKIPKQYKVHGIDVSSYQGKINWQKVKDMQEDDVSIQFAFIKASEGLLTIDPYFRRNWIEASKAGLVRGAYHFLRPKRDGKAQAKLFLQLVNIQKGDLPPVVDIERLDGVSPLKMQMELSNYLNYIEARTKVRPIIYTNLKFYEFYLRGTFDDYPLWIAHYHQSKLRIDKSRWKFWQHSDRAKIDGIGHVVDFNAFNGDSTDFERVLVK